MSQADELESIRVLDKQPTLPVVGLSEDTSDSWKRRGATLPVTRLSRAPRWLSRHRPKGMAR